MKVVVHQPHGEAQEEVRLSDTPAFATVLGACQEASWAIHMEAHSADWEEGLSTGQPSMASWEHLRRVGRAWLVGLPCAPTLGYPEPCLRALHLLAGPPRQSPQACSVSCPLPVGWSVAIFGVFTQGLHRDPSLPRHFQFSQTRGPVPPSGLMGEFWPLPRHPDWGFLSSGSRLSPVPHGDRGLSQHYLP